MLGRFYSAVWGFFLEKHGREIGAGRTTTNQTDGNEWRWFLYAAFALVAAAAPHAAVIAVCVSPDGRISKHLRQEKELLAGQR